MNTEEREWIAKMTPEERETEKAICLSQPLGARSVNLRAFYCSKYDKPTDENEKK